MDRVVRLGPHRHAPFTPLGAALLPAGPARGAPPLAPPPRAALPLADLVPDFTRLGQPIRDFIAPDVPQLEGFNGSDLARLLLPDLISPGSVYSFLLFVSCAAAVVYFEIPALLDDFLQERDFEALEEDLMDEARREAEGETAEERAAREAAAGRLAAARRAGAERRRGLAWLSAVTAIAIWCAGVLNKANPLQP